MRPTTVSQTGTGSSSAVPLDINQNPFAVSLGVVASGTVTYTVQHTFDDPYASGGLASATWFDHPTLAAKTASSDSNYAFPVRAVRVTVTAGTGSATLTIIQAGG